MRHLNSLCVLLVITASGVRPDDSDRVRRSEDAIKNALESANNMLDSAKQMLKDAGLDISNLPQDLTQMASSLFQMSGTNNTVFQNILNKVKVQMDDKMGKTVDIATIRNKYKDMLTNTDFLKEAKDLMGKSNNNPDDPQFKSGMESLIATYMEKALGAAGALSASLMSLLLAGLVYLGLV